MKTFSDYIKENADLLYKVAAKEYLANSDMWREKMAQEQGGEAKAFEKEEVIDFIATQYKDETDEDLQKVLK